MKGGVYRMLTTYPELTTATVHGPEWENDRTVYRFKTTIGTKG